MAELDGPGVSPVLPADPDLEAGPGLAPEFDGDLHDPPDSLHVERRERVVGKHLLAHVVEQESGFRIIARDPEDCLGQVVRAEGEELGREGDLARGECGPGDFDHRPHLEGHLDLLLLHHGLRLRLDECPLGGEFVQVGYERDHHLHACIDPVVHAPRRRLEECAGLHPRELGQEHREADSAGSEHRVRLEQVLGPGEEVLFRADLLEGVVDLPQGGQVLELDLELREFPQQLLMVGKELVERRIEEADHHGQPVHLPEEALEVGPLEGEEPLERLLALG